MLFTWLHSLAFLLLAGLSASAQTVSPSNSTSDLFAANSSPRFVLNGTEFRGASSVPLAPLGPFAQISYSDFVGISATGQLVNVGASNANDEVSKYQFSYLSCDPSAYTGNLDASSVFDIVVNQADTTVVILYSETSDHCNATDLSSVPDNIQSVLTTTDPQSASLLAKLNLNADSSGTCVIAANLSSYTNNTLLPDGGSVSSGTSTTALAMIVLYSLTGLITALFVAIIVTGTVRAHRHPERYGPSAVSGRGGQSRAKGIARAMLDTIPIVKFSGNREATATEQQKPEGDIEMQAPAGAGAGAGAAGPGTNEAIGTAITTPSVEPSLARGAAEPGSATSSLSKLTMIRSEGGNENKAGSTTAPARLSTPDSTSDDNLGCAICTDDFTQGEEMRVLPCNHKFHPDCVDPWLLNVSGTCPLCRIDLRPPGETDNDDNDEGTNESAGLPPPMAGPIGEAVASSSSSSSSLHDGTRRRDHHTFALLRSLASRNGGSSTGGVEERLAVLRRLRHERRTRRQESENSGDDVSNHGGSTHQEHEHGGRDSQSETEPQTEREHSGLARRFKEKFRIRTERNGAPASASASGAEPGAEPGSS